MYTLVATLLLFCTTLFAEGDKSAPVEAPTQPSTSVEAVPQMSYEGAFFKMLLTLFGLVLLIGAAIWMLRRLSQGQFRGKARGQSIQILEKRPLSAKSMLYLIEIDHKQILLSESQLEVRVLNREELSESES